LVRRRAVAVYLAADGCSLFNRFAVHLAPASPIHINQEGTVMPKTVSPNNPQVSEQVSLESEPFATAMRCMPLVSAEQRALIQERLLELAVLDRDELVDGYGHTNTTWEAPAPLSWDNEWPPLATGYDAGAGLAELVLFDDGCEVLVKWEGPLAEDLLKALGRIPAKSRRVMQPPPGGWLR
jgi:hypothetical protein